MPWEPVDQPEIGFRGLQVAFRPSSGDLAQHLTADLAEVERAWHEIFPGPHLGWSRGRDYWPGRRPSPMARDLIAVCPRIGLVRRLFMAVGVEASANGNDRLRPWYFRAGGACLFTFHGASGAAQGTGLQPSGGSLPPDPGHARTAVPAVPQSDHPAPCSGRVAGVF